MFVEIPRQMVTPTLLRPRTSPKEPECNVSLEQLAYFEPLWRRQSQAQVHVIVVCALWRTRSPELAAKIRRKDWLVSACGVQCALGWPTKLVPGKGFVDRFRL